MTIVLVRELAKHLAELSSMGIMSADILLQQNISFLLQERQQNRLNNVLEEDGIVQWSPP